LGFIKSLFRTAKVDNKPEMEIFQPENELEKLVERVILKEISGQDFIMSLMESPVFILSKTDKLSGIFSFDTNDRGTLVPIFTKNTRAEPTVRRNPEFTHLLKLKFGDFINFTESAFGVVLNPYWDKNIEWSAEKITAFKDLQRSNVKIDLHNVLQSLSSGNLIRGEVVNALLKSDVGILLKSNSISDFAENAFCIHIDSNTFFCVFSTPELLEEAKNSQTEYKSRAMLLGSNLIRLIPPGAGVVINPNTPLEIKFSYNEFQITQILGPHLVSDCS
jgi:hypothetical protein